MIRKAIWGFIIFIVLLVSLAILIPYLYQDEIKDQLLTEVNKEMDGSIEIKDFSLSLLRSFPDLTMILNEVIVNSNRDTTAPFIKAEAIEIGMDLMSAIRKEQTVQIHAIHLTSPDLYVHIDSDSTANYDIFPTSTDTEASSEDGGFDFSISNYSITNGQLTYIDAVSSISLNIDDIDHNGSGTFRGQEIDLSTKTTIPVISLSSDGNAYLKKDRFEADLDVLYNMETGRVDLKETDILLNQLKLIADGFIHPQEKGVEMELSFSAPENKFGQLWSVIPSVYKTDISDLKTNGDFNLKGSILGWYDYESGTLPRIAFDLKVNNGSVDYTSLPQKLEDVIADISFLKESGQSSSRTNIRNLEFKAAQSFLKSKAEVVQDGNQVAINGFANADLKLKDLPMEGDYSGDVKMDVNFGGDMAAIERGDYERLTLDGEASLKGIQVKQEGFPSIRLDVDNMQFSPQVVKASKVDLLIDESDITGEIEVMDPLGFFSNKKTPQVKANTKSKLLDVDAILAKISSEPETAGAEDEGTSSTSLLPFDMNVEWTGNIETLKFDGHVIEDLSGQLNTDGQRVVIPSSGVSYNGSRFDINADLDNVGKYTADAGTLKGDLTINGGKLDLNKFVSESSEEAQDQGASSVIILPENMDIRIASNIEEVIYGDMTLNTIKGDLGLADQTLDLSKVTASFLGGDMQLMGALKSDGQSEPLFNMKYEVFKLPFDGVAAQIKAIDQIIPISKYIDGIFNSTLVLEGKLGEDMFPDLNSLTASGYIETLKGALGGLPFIEKLSKLSAVKDLVNVQLDNTKNWFEIKDGKFFIQPFDIVHDDIKMNISGSTGLNQTIDLDIKAIVPKEKLDKLPGGSEVNAGISWLSSEVNRIGIPLGEIKTYTLGIDLGGQITDPKINIKMLDFTKGSINSVIADKKEELKEKLVDTLETKKQEVIDKAKEEVNKKTEEVRDTVEKRIEKEVDKKVDEVKKEIEKKTGEAVDSVLQDKGKETVDKIKEKLKDFDLFKRKKK